MSIDLDHIRPKVPATLEEITYPNGTHAGWQRVITCPYCGRTHLHGQVLGDRNSHCTTDVLVRNRMVRSDAHGNPGYELCNPSDAVDWDTERALAQLWVARATYRRLKTLHDHMEPWTVKERRVKAELKTQADALAEILRASGVNL